MAAGSRVTVAQSGQDAIHYAEHGAFDTTVIVSTGSYMDFVETFLNIRDLRPSMEIILLPDNPTGNAAQAVETVARAFRRTHTLTIEELPIFLQEHRSR